ncbi:MAG: helix-turn-helix domain-containing protein [Anaerolineaceae bacterium]|nr:helix-turn-helix domain-containing protein [Anaerolineaceae bacterium]
MDTENLLFNVYRETCPTRAVLGLIADKWTALVIGLLEDRPKRFSELQRGIEGISQKMLTQTLRELERDGLVTRTIYPEIPPHVEYALTELGMKLQEPIGLIRKWAEENMNQVIQSQIAYDAREPLRGLKAKEPMIEIAAQQA